ncbi:DNA primase family protein [Microbacterium resistens]|uniref:DNA primase family protein n=1 Tax=Microbacterium resistens TaxID=156977 RepID=UPI0008316921|nr:phage/plasmid primase, P4 family [Microbacterium resistens]
MPTSIISDLAGVANDDCELAPVFDDDPLTRHVDERARLLEAAQLLRSHARIAHLVAADCVGRFIHVAGLGWYRWTGKRLVPDVEDKAITRAVTHAIARLAPDALGDKELLADLLRSQTSSGLAGVVRLMSTIESLTVDAEELDADPWLLNTPTGVLDLRELEQGVSWRDLTVRPHDPLYRMTQITAGEYDPAAQSDLWDAFLKRSLPDEAVRRYLQQTTGGLGLVGEQLEHMLPILTGAGRNGKGVFYGALLHALGDYASVANPNLFNIDRNATADKPNPALLGLRARRLVFMSETAKSAELDSARVKALTGGDRIKARGVHSKTTVEFDPSHQLALITNHAPQLPADDPAVWERVRNVPWDVVVPPDERDPRLSNKLKGAASAILAWALSGLEDYLTNGLVPAPRVLDATEQYKADQDTVSIFIAERCEDGCSDRDSDTTKVLHTDYQRFCRANGVMREHILGERLFGKRLDALGYPPQRTGARRFRQGLRLLPDDEEARAEELRAENAARLKALPSMSTPEETSQRTGPSERLYFPDGGSIQYMG